jgi:eukaryotic-like serine/threonine-protein kinase
MSTRNDGSGTSRILTLVFTDLADSTALKTRRGDQAVGELITRHRTQVQRLAVESGGRIIDWADDGCFLTCETPSAAVLFALRLQQVHGDEPDLPGVRIGLHLGEVSERPGPDGDGAHPRVEGLAVDLAARISGLARPGQVLMSSSVADNARQRLDSHAFAQPVRWQTHGSYTLKGFDEALEIREAGLEGIASFAAPAASEKATPTRPPQSPVRGATGNKARRVGVTAALIGVPVHEL